MTTKNVWQVFSEETPGVAEAWMKMSEEINVKGALDQRTTLLIRIGIYSVRLATRWRSTTSSGRRSRRV